MADGGGLSDEEREELEQLRAEKARREQEQRDAQERAELQRLRAQRQRAEQDREAELRDARLRKRGRQMMQPDEDDLRMAPGQKAVILCVVAVAAVWLIASLLG